MSEWEVPGYDVLELLGYGSTGEVWRAQERASGQLVVLRRLAGGDRDAIAEVRRQATVVRSLQTPHVIRLRTVTRAKGDDVLVLDHADGGSLEALLRTRRTLTAGEVVTVLAPLAEALGQAHALGLFHRRLRAPRVLLDGKGKPLVDGLGLDGLYDATDSLDPTGALAGTADVWALGALGHRMLTGEEPHGVPLAEQLPTAPLPLLAALESALDFDPGSRPTATDLAAALLAACPATPVEGLAPARRPGAPVRRPLPRRLPRPALIGSAAALALVAVVVVGWTWGARTADATASVPHATATAPGTARGTAPATDWTTVLTDLDVARAAAFRSHTAAALSAVYAPGSAPLGQDQASLAALEQQGSTVRGLQHRLIGVTLISTKGDKVVLRVQEQLGAYLLVDRVGKVVERHTRGPVLTDEVALLHTAQGWRIDLVRPVS